MTNPDNFAAVLSRLNLDMLAGDLARTISDYGYAEQGLDVDSRAIREALPAFITACLTNQARLDEEEITP